MQEKLSWGKEDKADGFSQNDGLLVPEDQFLSTEFKDLILYVG